MISEEQGQWILGGGYDQALTEYSMITNNGTNFEKIVIDLIIIEDGKRYVIDYKSSYPAEGQSEEQFIKQELGKYKEKMMQYKTCNEEAFEEPVNIALYFPMIGKLTTYSEDAQSIAAYPFQQNKLGRFNMIKRFAQFIAGKAAATQLMVAGIALLVVLVAGFNMVRTINHQDDITSLFLSIDKADTTFEGINEWGLPLLINTTTNDKQNFALAEIGIKKSYQCVDIIIKAWTKNNYVSAGVNDSQTNAFNKASGIALSTPSLVQLCDEDHLQKVNLVSKR